jgi:hypothetical protein
MDKHFLPLGRFIFAASCTNAFEAAQATSLAFVILNFQVQFADLGLEAGSPTSFSLRITIVFSLVFAASHLFNCSGV